MNEYLIKKTTLDSIATQCMNLYGKNDPISPDTIVSDLTNANNELWEQYDDIDYIISVITKKLIKIPTMNLAVLGTVDLPLTVLYTCLDDTGNICSRYREGIVDRVVLDDLVVGSIVAVCMPQDAGSCIAGAVGLKNLDVRDEFGAQRYCQYWVVESGGSSSGSLDIHLMQ